MRYADGTSPVADFSAVGEAPYPGARPLALATTLLLLGCASGSGAPGSGAGARAARLPQPKQLEALIDSVVTKSMVEDRIPGAAVVWIGAGRRLERAYGLADVAALRPVTVDGTVFRIGSITKVVTALALTQLIDRGEIGLDDPVGSYLPGLRTTSPGGTPVRVRHLLSHTAGYDQVGLRRQVADPRERPDLQSFLARELVPVREPGRIGVYDTYGITLAGRLLERMSGSSYAEHVRRHVFAPLGMESSWVEVPASARARLAVGYGVADGELEPQPYEWYVTLPASSIDATAADMGRLLEALLGDGGGMLTPEMTERVRNERMLAYGDMGAFSWGFWEERRNEYRAIHHGGIMQGYSSELYIVPDAGLGFFVAYNRDGETGPPARLREALVELIHDRILPPRSTGPRLAAPRVPASAERVAGVYGSTVACYTCTEGEGWTFGGTVVAAAGPGVISLYRGSSHFYAVDSLAYVNPASGRELRFLEDESGRVRYMVQGPNSYVRLDDVLLEELLGSGWRDAPPQPIVARVHRSAGNWAAAAEAYASLARREPANGRFPFYEGFSRLHTGSWTAARDAFRRALEVGQWSSWSRYYIAASHAGEGAAAAAWSELDRAIEMGFGDADLFRTEPWWQHLQDTPEYRAALKRLIGN